MRTLEEKKEIYKEFIRRLVWAEAKRYGWDFPYYVARLEWELEEVEKGNYDE